MSTSPVASVLALFQRLFPHRQFYLRSRGSVQFFELSPTFQMTVAAAGHFLLGWVAYSSVEVIFKAQIMTAKDQRYSSMQTAYESRISQMQLSYDDLNSMLMQKQAMEKVRADVKRQVAVMEGYAGRTVQLAEADSVGDGTNTLIMEVADA